MRISTGMMAGASVGAVGALAVSATMLFGGCSSSTPPPPPPAATGGSCATTPGTFPPPNCDPLGDNSCTAPSPACPTMPCSGSSACLAMADNGGKAPYDMRIRKLNVTAPHNLAQHFIQADIIDRGINLHNLCGESGDGTFSWILQFDPTTKTLTTGGAPPSTDPFGVGYCFVHETLSGLNVQPTKATMTQAADGTWSSDVIPKLYVPIFVPMSRPIVLPITDAQVKGVAVSADGNCIGAYNPGGVDSPISDGTCPDNGQCVRWHTAGSLGGFITLQEADGIAIALNANKSLCVMLTGISDPNDPTHCPRDKNGNVTATGDYCSKGMGMPATSDCADSYWLAATFAASAAKINDGSMDPNCNGSMVMTGDAGTHAGGADAGTDAAGGDSGSADAAGD